MHEVFKDYIFFPVQDAILFSAGRWEAAWGLSLGPSHYGSSYSTSQGTSRDEGSTNDQIYTFHFYTEELEKWPQWGSLDPVEVP